MRILLIAYYYPPQNASGGQRPMKLKHIEFYVGLIAASAAFLVIQRLTHWEFALHLAAIPLEILIAVFVVERFLENRETKLKRQQLMYIKSYMFRSEMRNLFIANFAALKHPAIDLAKLRDSTLDELREMRRQAETVEYASPEAMEPVIMEYVRAEPVWHSFKDVTHLISPSWLPELSS